MIFATDWPAGKMHISLDENINIFTTLRNRKVYKYLQSIRTKNIPILNFQWKLLIHYIFYQISVYLGVVASGRC